MRHAASLLLVITASLSAATLTGSAATVGGLGPSALGGGVAVVAECDTNGFDDSYTVTGGVVTHVTVAGIADPGCEGGLLSVVLAGSDGTSLGAGGPVAVPADGDTDDNSITVTLNPDPDRDDVSAIHVAVTGP